MERKDIIVKVMTKGFANEYELRLYENTTKKEVSELLENERLNLKTLSEQANFNWDIISKTTLEKVYGLTVYEIWEQQKKEAELLKETNEVEERAIKKEREKLGKILVEYRKKAGLTQNEVAERMGTVKQVISRWEHGYCSPNLKSTMQLAKIYNCDITDLTNFYLI